MASQRSVKSRPPPNSPAALARARGESDERVDCILDLMMRGRWAPGRDHRSLAERFKVSVDTIERDARIAGAVLRRFMPLAPEQRDEARAQLLADLERHRRIALTRQRAVSRGEAPIELVLDPDVKAANQVLDLRSKVLGLYEAQKLAVTVEDKRPATPAEEIAEIDTLLEQLTARRAELVAEQGRHLQ